MYNRPTRCCGCVIYYVFSIFQDNRNYVEHKNTPPMLGGGIKYLLYCLFPSQHWCIFVLKIIPVVLEDTKYVIYNTPTTPSRPIIHALQLLDTCLPKYHKSILQRIKMGIFICTKFASPSEFECDSNALIFNPIGPELSELHEFYKMHPEMENFRPKHTANNCHIVLIQYQVKYGNYFFPRRHV